MSRALSFLMNARPEAMRAYFDFLTDNGSRLDPKTRALISVITKAAVQTDKGSSPARQLGSSPAKA